MGSDAVMGSDVARVRARLGLGEAYDAFLEQLIAVGEPELPARLPEPEEAGPLLERLGFTEQDAVETMAARPDPNRDRELWWLLERCRQRLAGDLGGVDPLGRWTSLPAALGTVGRFFYVHVFLSALEDIRAWHRARGIPDAISWATLEDLGRNVAIYRRVHGQGGFDAQDWLTLHFRGSIYQLGRLQFDRWRLHRWDPATLEILGGEFREGDLIAGIHIPDCGPFTPEACDESFRQARRFFPRYFPEDRYPVHMCGSWLLDPQLAEYLPEDSNIVRFQRRFRMLPPRGRNTNSTIIGFVFRRASFPEDPAALDTLPQRTTLERAIVRHIRSGRHWESRWGWLPFEPIVDPV